MGSIGRLRLDCWIPPGVVMVGGTRCREIEANAAGFEADEEDRDISGLEAINLALPIASAPVQIAVIDRHRLQTVLNEAEHGGKLAEDQDAMSIVDGVLQ